MKIGGSQFAVVKVGEALALRSLGLKHAASSSAVAILPAAGGLHVGQPGHRHEPLFAPDLSGLSGFYLEMI